MVAKDSRIHFHRSALSLACFGFVFAAGICTAFYVISTYTDLLAWPLTVLLIIDRQSLGFLIQFLDWFVVIENFFVHYD